MCMRDMWVVQWYCIFEGLVEMCLITKITGVVCEVVAGFLQVPEVQHPHGLITE